MTKKKEIEEKVGRIQCPKCGAVVGRNVAVPLKDGGTVRMPSKIVMVELYWQLRTVDAVADGIVSVGPDSTFETYYGDKDYPMFVCHSPLSAYVPKWTDMYYAYSLCDHEWTVPDFVLRAMDYV